MNASSAGPWNAASPGPSSVSAAGKGRGRGGETGEGEEEKSVTSVSTARRCVAKSVVPCAPVTAKQAQPKKDHQATLCNSKPSNPEPTVSPTCWVRAPVKAERDAGRPGVIRILSAVSIEGGGKAKDQDKQALEHVPWKALL